jgi:hypothetical protein
MNFFPFQPVGPSFTSHDTLSKMHLGSPLYLEIVLPSLSSLPGLPSFAGHDDFLVVGFAQNRERSSFISDGGIRPHVRFSNCVGRVSAFDLVTIAMISTGEPIRV